MVARSKADVEALLKTLRAKGDPFGVADDSELQMAATEVARQQYAETPNGDNLRRWLGVLAASLDLGASVDVLRAHEQLLRRIRHDDVEEDIRTLLAGLLGSLAIPPRLHGMVAPDSSSEAEITKDCSPPETVSS
jgi:hypothetical protein